MSSVKPPFVTEEYAVERPPPPESLDLLASGVRIAQIKQGKSTHDHIFFVQGFEQDRIFIEDMITGVKQYLRRNGRTVTYVLWDKEYDRFEFYTVRKELVNVRAIGDNPQA